MKFSATLTLFLVLFFSSTIASSSFVLHDKSEYTVYVFLSNTCPICQEMTYDLKNIYSMYHPRGIDVIGVFPDVQLSLNDVREFKDKYKIPFYLKIDEDMLLTHEFNATVTPEAVFVDRSGNVLYQGRINDRYLALGKRRRVSQHHELEDAINSVLKHGKVEKSYVSPVGCIISH